MRVQLKPQAQAVKARPRRYDPVKTGWLVTCIAALVAFGFIVWNIQAVWASPATAVRKRDTFRLVSEYQAVNSQLMAGASRRTKRVASNRVIQEDAWTAERVRAWRAAQDLVAQAVPLYHPRPGCVVLMFPDASDFHWGSFLLKCLKKTFVMVLRLER